MALKGPDNIQGTVEVMADNGTGATAPKPQKKGPGAVPVSDKVQNLPSMAMGHVGDWDVITVGIEPGTSGVMAVRSARAKRQAEAQSVNTVTADFEETTDDKDFVLNAATHIDAALTEGTATVQIVVTVTTNTGAGVAPPGINQTYTLKVNPTNATKLTVDDGTNQTPMSNPGKVDLKVPQALVPVLLAKNKYKLKFVVTVDAKGVNEELFAKVTLKLHK